MRMPQLIAIWGLAVSGCCSVPQQQVQVFDAKGIALVQAELKREVGVYLAYREKNKDRTPALELPLTTTCGSGDIDFNVTQVKLKLTTATDRKLGATGSATFPVGEVSLGPSAGYSNERTLTQTLTYNLWLSRFQNPDVLKGYGSEDDLKSAPIAKALIDLRNGLIQGARQYRVTKAGQQVPQACFVDYNLEKPASDVGNTFEMAVQVVDDTSTGLTIKFLVLSLGASTDDKRTTGNTITVSFVQSDLQGLQDAVDDVAAYCKRPLDTEDKKRNCAKAKVELEKEKNKRKGAALYQLQE